MSTYGSIPAYDEYRESLLEKMAEALDTYILCKLKIEQLRSRGKYAAAAGAIGAQMVAAKDQIAEILVQEKDLTWATK